MKALFILLLVMYNFETYCLSMLKCNLPDTSCSDSDLVKIYWNLNGLHQENPNLIEAIRNDVLVSPDLLPLSLVHGPSKKKLMGQFNQVEMVEKLLHLKSSQKGGFFIEAGAGCGEVISNTLYLELMYNWTGLLIEPNPDLLKSLYQKHRKACSDRPISDFS